MTHTIPTARKLWWLIWNQPSSLDNLMLKQQTEDTKKKSHLTTQHSERILLCIFHIAFQTPIIFNDILVSQFFDHSHRVSLSTFLVFCLYNLYWQDCSPKHRLLQSSHRTRIINAHICPKSLLCTRLGTAPIWRARTTDPCGEYHFI